MQHHSTSFRLAFTEAAASVIALQVLEQPRDDLGRVARRRAAPQPATPRSTARDHTAGTPPAIRPASCAQRMR